MEVKSEMNLKNEIVNVISSFNKTGAKVKGFFRNAVVLGFLGGIFLVFIYLLLLETNRFLVVYDEQRKHK